MNISQFKTLMRLWLYIGHLVMWLVGAGISVAVAWYGTHYIILTLVEIAKNAPTSPATWVSVSLIIGGAVVAGIWVGLSGIWQTSVVTLREFKRHKADFLKLGV